MINLVSMLVVMALLGGAMAVIGATIHARLDAVVAALAGRSVRANTLFVPAPRVRVTVRPQAALALARPVLRAAA